MMGADESWRESRQSAAALRKFILPSTLASIPAPARGIGMALALAAYVIAVHYVTARGDAPLLTLALTAAPLLIAVELNIARAGGAFRALLFGIACGALIWLLRGTLAREASRIALAQHVGINLFLCWLFGQSLGGKKEALVTRFARAVHGSAMRPEVVSYTRGATLAWTLFFLFVACGSLVLYVLAPLSVWSVFANLLNLPLVAAMFVGEYVYRVRRLGRFGQTSIVDGFRAFRAHRSHAKLAHGSADEP